MFEKRQLDVNGWYLHSTAHFNQILENITGGNLFGADVHTTHADEEEKPGTVRYIQIQWNNLSSKECSQSESQIERERERERERGADLGTMLPACCTSS
jgi:hypothetical protein